MVMVTWSSSVYLVGGGYYLNFNPFWQYSPLQCTRMAGSAKQQWASLMKGPSTTKSVNKSLMTRVMTAQRGNANSSHIGTIYFHGWNTILIMLPLHTDNSSTFYVGSTNFRIELLKTHSTSTHHHLCSIKIKQELYPTNPQDTHLGQAVIQLHETKRIELESPVRTAYYIRYKKHPFADFEWSCELQKLNGLALGENYSNAKRSLLSLLNIFMIVSVDSISFNS